MASHAAWVRFPWHEPFLWKRFALSCAVATASITVCFSAGWGIAGLLTLPIAFWPFPPRVSVDAHGLVCRWLFLERRLALSTITSVRLEPDPRRGALTRPDVLSLGLHHQPDLLIQAPHDSLAQLQRDLETELARSGHR